MEEVVRRWVNEIQEATSSKHAMVQFHALALLYELKKNDRLALHKVFSAVLGRKQGDYWIKCLSSLKLRSLSGIDSFCTAKLKWRSGESVSEHKEQEIIYGTHILQTQFVSFKRNRIR